jgi:hypothetical protein
MTTSRAAPSSVASRCQRVIRAARSSAASRNVFGLTSTRHSGRAHRRSAAMSSWAAGSSPSRTMIGHCLAAIVICPALSAAVDGLRRGSVAAGLQGQGNGWAEQVGETDIEFVDTDEEMQHPFVDAQAAGGEAGAGCRLRAVASGAAGVAASGRSSAAIRACRQGEAETDPGPRRAHRGQGRKRGRVRHPFRHRRRAAAGRARRWTGRRRRSASRWRFRCGVPCGLRRGRGRSAF